MKVLAMITLRGSHKLLRMGSIQSPAALPRMAVRGRAFLSEQANDNRVRYYKDGLSEAKPILSSQRWLMGFAALNPSYDSALKASAQTHRAA
jgi:hypothetical protein